MSKPESRAPAAAGGAPPPGSIRSSFTGAVLAGGRSSRLGRPKWREPVGGVPMGLRAAAALRPHAREVVLVTGDPAAAALGLPLLADALPGRGPLGGLVAALERAAAAGDTGVLVLACDLPLVDAGLVGALVDAFRAPGHGGVVAPEHDGRLQPLCAAWSVATLAAAGEALRAGDLALRALAERVGARRLAAAEWRAYGALPDALLNVNTRADLERAEALLHAPRAGAARSVSRPAG